MKEKSKGTVTLGGGDMPEVKVCDVINGKPKVKHVAKGNVIEFHLRYSMFRKEVKRYDKTTLEEIK